MTAALEIAVEASSWDVRRMRAEMLQTLPTLPKALCRSPGADPDLWHPARSNRKQESAAIKVCMMCTETLACLSFAIRAHPISGVWGGTTEAQRRAVMVSISQREDVRSPAP